jgi:uncharacterized protein YdeI (YjbR/CyaY-like superfamily)
LTNHKTLYLTDRSQWRAWLEANYNKATEIWLVYPNKSTGKPRILYNDAVEEALCFGWIDSIQKSLDKDHAIQRFTPRNLKSDYCQANKERLKWLSDKGMRKNMSPFRQKDQPKLNHVITLLGEIGNRYSKSPA